MASFCGSCPHGCVLSEGQRGLCKARICREGSVVPEAYGRTTGLALDPIEKKPFACYLPGSRVLSLGSYGCNMSCSWCQNWHISTAGPDEVEWRNISPEELVKQALALRSRGCVGLAFTYNEPLICWEFVRDTAQLARKNGLVSTIVSNGMCSNAVLKEIAPLIDAANIDLKCFGEQGYKQAGGSLQTVKETIEVLAKTESCHLEVTWLAVPGVSADEEQMGAAAAWLASLDRSIPLHVTRFFPCHHMGDEHPTPVKQVYKLAAVAGRHLDKVFVGNV